MIGNIYPLDYGPHVERVKLLTCPIGKVAVLFEDGANITTPYQNQRQLMNELMPVHGSPKTMTELPENERELAIILKRERLKRSYHATNGDIKEYIDGLKKVPCVENSKRLGRLPLPLINRFPLKRSRNDESRS